VPGKRVQIDDEIWHVLDVLARDRMMTFQELADEAFTDLLKKHDRPVTLKAALRRSAQLSADVVPFRSKEGSKARAKEQPKDSSKQPRAAGAKKPRRRK
jgi:hypothetical protein